MTGEEDYCKNPPIEQHGFSVCMPCTLSGSMDYLLQSVMNAGVEKETVMTLRAAGPEEMIRICSRLNSRA